MYLYTHICMYLPEMTIPTPPYKHNDIYVYIYEYTHVYTYDGNPLLSKYNDLCAHIYTYDGNCLCNDVCTYVYIHMYIFFL